MKTRGLFLGCLSLLVALSLQLHTVTARTEEIKVLIARPAEGETFYFGPSTLLYNISITGAVIVPEGNPEDVRLTLEIFHGDVSLGSQQIRANPSGTYIFFATVNPTSSTGQHSDSRRYMGLTDTCGGSCHDTKVAQVTLVPGHLLVRVTAEDGRGRKTSAERHIIVDGSIRATIPVRVVHQERPEQGLSGIPVQASTWIYLWRARHYSVASEASGYAPLTAEVLSEAPTHYMLRVDPVVVDGVYYEGVVPAKVDFSPGERSTAAVTLEVISKSGSIEGRLIGTQVGIPPEEGLTIWAVAPDKGYCVASHIDATGQFQFRDLPIDNYLLALDPAELAERSLTSDTVSVDLTRSPAAKTEIPVSTVNGASVRVTVVGEEGPLPFAWLSLPEADIVNNVYPGSGEGYLVGIARGRQPIVVMAPGYYSAAETLSVGMDEKEGMTVKLARQPDSTSIPWGSGTVFVPAESRAELTDRGIRLEQGWLWGSGGNAHAAPLLVGDVEVRMNEGSFALEALAGRPPIFYLISGSADLVGRSRVEPVRVSGGQMVSLETLKAMPLSTAAVTAGEVIAARPPDATWQPGPGARLRAQLVLLGIGSAQVVTFITYILGALSVVGGPILLVFLLIRRRKKG